MRDGWKEISAAEYARALKSLKVRLSELLATT